jgi:hypothetical protein
MKLLDTLKQIICESDDFVNYKLETIKNDNNIFLVFDTYHQRFERGGEKKFDDVIEKLLINNQYKSGVDTNIILNSIRNKFYEILDILENEDDTEPIILVDSFDRGSDYIEYLIDFKKIKPRFDPNDKIYKIKIITSAFSNDGLWLKKFGGQKSADRFIIENIKNYNFKIFYL